MTLAERSERTRNAVKEEDTIVTDWLVAQLYNKIVEDYLQHKLERNTPGDLLEAPVFVSCIKEALMHGDIQNIVDVGTGTGWLIKKVVKPDVLNNFGTLTAIDVSERMISEAKDHFDDERLKFEVVSIADLVSLSKFNLIEDSQDLVISSNALDCVANLELALTNIASLLKRRSFFIFSIRHPQRNAEYVTGDSNALWINGEPEQNPEEKVTVEQGWYREIWPGTGGNSVLRYYRSFSKWLKLLDAAGFEIVQTTAPRITQENVGFIESVNPELVNIYSKRPGALIFMVRKH